MEQCDNYEIFDDFKPAEEQNSFMYPQLSGKMSNPTRQKPWLHSIILQISKPTLYEIPFKMYQMTKRVCHKSMKNILGDYSSM